MSAMVQYEPGVDVITERFLNQTERLYAITGARCDFAQWLQYYAFDVIGQITYSKSHGFVDKNEDIEGMCGYLGKIFSYVAPVSIVPSMIFILATIADLVQLDWTNPLPR